MHIHWHADFAHSSISLNVAHSEDFMSIEMSWTLINSSFSSYFTSYEVQYTVCPTSAGINCGSTLQSVNITDISSTHYSIPNVALWMIYNITVLNIPIVNESTHVLPSPASTGALKQRQQMV